MPEEEMDRNHFSPPAGNVSPVIAVEVAIESRERLVNPAFWDTSALCSVVCSATAKLPAVRQL